MFGYVTFNVKYYILSQIFYKKKSVIIDNPFGLTACELSAI